MFQRIVLSSQDWRAVHTSDQEPSNNYEFGPALRWRIPSNLEIFWPRGNTVSPVLDSRDRQLILRAEVRDTLTTSYEQNSNCTVRK